MEPCAVYLFDHKNVTPDICLPPGGGHVVYDCPYRFPRGGRHFGVATFLLPSFPATKRATFDYVKNIDPGSSDFFATNLTSFLRPAWSSGLGTV
jgi:hypothetical protein